MSALAKYIQREISFSFKRMSQGGRMIWLYEIGRIKRVLNTPGLLWSIQFTSLLLALSLPFKNVKDSQLTQLAIRRKSRSHASQHFVKPTFRNLGIGCL